MTLSLARLGRLVRKEVSSILRDRRTIITLVLMPLLLYPLLTLAFQQFLLASDLHKKSPSEWRLGVANESDLQILRQWHFLDNGMSPTEPNEPERKLTIWEAPDIEEALRTGKIDLGVHFLNRGEFDPFQPLECRVSYLADSPGSREALDRFERRMAQSNEDYLRSLLKRRAALRGRVMVAVQRQEFKPQNVRPTISISALIPLILILMTITGAVYPAIDLTAGERERGTLEVLVAAPVPRMGLLFAKYISVWVVAVLTAVVNLGTMTITLLVSGLGKALLGEADLTVLLVVQVFLLLLLFAAFFSAVLLAVTSFARSFKEAQAYLIPLMLVSISPGVVALLPGLKLDGPLVVVPLLNIVLLARDLFEGTAHLGPALIVISTTLLYSAAAIGLAARIFGDESVLYSEQGTWGDLFRRAPHPRAQATVSGALLCLALMFPASFLLNGLMAQLKDAAPELRLSTSIAATVLLFGVFPLISAWRGHVILRRGFGLTSAGTAGWLPALLLGVCLWPIVHEVIELQRTLGVSTLTERHQQLIQQSLEALRTVSPVLVLTAMALVPAVFEELVFRGFLFNALRRVSSESATIVGSAVLFGVFHLVVTDALAIERLLPSTFLGLILGWLAWKTGSVVPGMLLHFLHNGSVTLLAYYEPWLVEQGWMEANQQHLPFLLVLGAAAGCGVALALVRWLVPSVTLSLTAPGELETSAPG